MREIKFRAWLQGISTMIYWDAIKDIKIGKILDNYAYIPMQYTGLKDKNGKEIYEGDIIEIDDDWKSGAGERGKVMWDKKNATFRLFCYTKYGGEGWFMPENKTWTKLKIIGNTYENSKLLKEK